MVELHQLDLLRPESEQGGNVTAPVTVGRLDASQGLNGSGPGSGDQAKFWSVVHRRRCSESIAVALKILEGDPNMSLSYSIKESCLLYAQRPDTLGSASAARTATPSLLLHHCPGSSTGATPSHREREGGDTLTRLLPSATRSSQIPLLAGKKT